jgi:hypothetical protein
MALAASTATKARTTTRRQFLARIKHKRTYRRELEDNLETNAQRY